MKNDGRGREDDDEWFAVISHACTAGIVVFVVDVVTTAGRWGRCGAVHSGGDESVLREAVTAWLAAYSTWQVISN